MVRQIWIAECDLCGHIEEAKIALGRYNETDYTLPDGWGHGHNKDYTICPECLARLADRKKGSDDYGRALR